MYARLLYNMELERIACLPPAGAPASTAAATKPSPAKPSPRSKRKPKDDAAASTSGTVDASKRVRPVHLHCAAHTDTLQPCCEYALLLVI